MYMFPLKCVFDLKTISDSICQYCWDLLLLKNQYALPDHII